jgi:hypothetical protein
MSAASAHEARPAVSERDAFERAQTIADRNGLPGFCAWRAGLERRYTVMPPWYWNQRDCRKRYIAHIRTAIDWQRREHRINQGNAEFQQLLAGRTKQL